MAPIQFFSILNRIGSKNEIAYKLKKSGFPKKPTFSDYFLILHFI